MAGRGFCFLLFCLSSLQTGSMCAIEKEECILSSVTGQRTTSTESKKNLPNGLYGILWFLSSVFCKITLDRQMP